MKQRKRDPGGEGSQHSQTASHEQGTDQRGGFEALRLARQGAREQGDSDRFWWEHGEKKKRKGTPVMAEHLMEMMVRTALWQQFSAAIAMLENALLACPEERKPSYVEAAKRKEERTRA